MAKPAAKNLADFRASHDPAVVVPNRIKSAIDSLRKDGPEAWEYEKDFLMRAHINAQQVAGYREQFLPHIVAVRSNGVEKRIWFADPKVASKARGE